MYGIVPNVSFSAVIYKTQCSGTNGVILDMLYTACVWPRDLAHHHAGKNVNKVPVFCFLAIYHPLFQLVSLGCSVVSLVDAVKDVLSVPPSDVRRPFDAS